MPAESSSGRNALTYIGIEGSPGEPLFLNQMCSKKPFCLTLTDPSKVSLFFAGLNTRMGMLGTVIPPLEPIKGRNYRSPQTFVLVFFVDLCYYFFALRNRGLS